MKPGPKKNLSRQAWEAAIYDYWLTHNEVESCREIATRFPWQGHIYTTQRIWQIVMLYYRNGHIKTDNQGA